MHKECVNCPGAVDHSTAECPTAGREQQALVAPATPELPRYNAPRGTTLSESDRGELVMAAEHDAAIDALRTQVAKSRAEIAKLQQEQAELQEALEHARLFIRNGIELDFIRMPDADTPDPAHDTLPKIEKALATCSQAQQGGSND